MIAALLASASLAFQPAPCANNPAETAAAENAPAVECGWVAVPLNEGDTRTIRLWTARIRAAQPEPEADPILYVNGGPGIATVDAILPHLAESRTLQALGRTRDIVLFDQRGSGRSEQALCPGLAGQLDAIEREGLDPAAEDERSRAAFVACRAELDAAGIALDAYTTAATAEDIEALREAFGAKRWNLLSVSYGTLVALQVMRERPTTVRAAILNSPYPPNSVTWAEQASSTAAAYAAIGRACDAQADCHARFGDVVGKLEQTLARLEREPLKDGDALITGRKFADALWPLAVASDSNAYVPQAIARAHDGDAALIRRLVEMFGGGDSFGDYSPAQGIAISCHESGRTAEWYARARALYPTLVSPAPDDSWDRLCAAFRPGFADPAFFAPVASEVPTLIYTGSLDPATPVVDAYQSLRFLTRATLVEIEGAAHSPLSLDACTRGIAAAFLDRPEERPDLACIAARQPFAFALDGLDELLDGFAE